MQSASAYKQALSETVKETPAAGGGAPPYVVMIKHEISEIISDLDSDALELGLMSSAVATELKNRFAREPPQAVPCSVSPSPTLPLSQLCPTCVCVLICSRGLSFRCSMRPTRKPWWRPRRRRLQPNLFSVLGNLFCLLALYN